MEVLVFAAALLGLLTVRWRDVADGIENFRNNFRGGGGPPTHPSPADDGALLRRRR